MTKNRKRYKKLERKRFKNVKTITKIIRKECAADPLKEIRETGIKGRMLATVIEPMIEKPVQKASYALAGLSYDKDTDSPSKGNLLYTGWYLFFKAICAILVCMTLVAFLRADSVSQLSMIAGSVPIIVFVRKLLSGIKSIGKKFKSK